VPIGLPRAKGLLKGSQLKTIKYSTTSADKSTDDLWTLVGEERSTDGKDDVELTLTRTLSEKVDKRFREHTVNIELTPNDDFWRMTNSKSSAELLETARSYLQIDWQNLLLAFEKNADRFDMGCTSYGSSVEEIKNSNGQHIRYNRIVNELLFKIQKDGEGQWLKLSPELHDLLFSKLKISSIKQLIAELKFRDYQKFGTLERLFGEFGREIKREERKGQSKLPTLERGSWLPTAGTSFYISNFDEIRCSAGLVIGENFDTLVELKVDPDNLQSKSRLAVRILKDGYTLGFIKEGYSQQLFNYLNYIGGSALCNANLYFSPVPEGIPQVNGEGGVPGNAIQLDLKIPQIEWIEDLLENSSNSSGPQLMSFD
jgi:hypothetical protein